MSGKPWAYIVISGEPDSEVDSAWASIEDAEKKCAELHSRWPGMGYSVLNIPFHPAEAVREANTLQAERHLERIIDHTGEHWPNCECISCLNYRDAVACLRLLRGEPKEDNDA